MFLTLVFVIVFLTLGLLENYFHQKRLKSVPIRILVNGTRGKTSVARMIASALNENGIKTICRTTGSQAQIVMPDGTVLPFKRRLKARITEMIPLLRTCAENQVQCLVVECMALAEENQRTISRVLVKPTHLVITNSFIDHVVEIGATHEDTVWCLANSIYPGCKVFCTEEDYKKYCDDLGCECVVTGDVVCDVPESGIAIHPSNAGLALAVCESLGVGSEKAIEGFGRATGDVGLLGNLNGKNGSLLIPSFSINDLHCMGLAVKDANEKYEGKKLCVIYNNRSDREYRIPLIAQVLSETQSMIDEVFCIGEYPGKVKRYLERKTQCKARATDIDTMFEIINESDENVVFLGLGNIKGAGEALIYRFTQGGEC